MPDGSIIHIKCHFLIIPLQRIYWPLFASLRRILLLWQYYQYPLYIYIVHCLFVQQRCHYTASLGCNRVCNGKTHRCMAKDIYHGKSHGIWVLPCSGLSHSSMVKAMGIMKLYIHGFCHGPLLHGFCNALFKRKIPKIISLDWHLWLPIAFSLSLECFLHCSLAFKHFPNIFMKC